MMRKVFGFLVNLNCKRSSCMEVLNMIQTDYLLTESSKLSFNLSIGTCSHQNDFKPRE